MPASDAVTLAFILVAQFEGFRANAYQDQTGRWTIGYGRTENVNPTCTTTIEAESDWTKARLGWLEERIDRMAGRDMKSNQMAALLSFAYNLGLAALERSTLFSLVQAGQWLPASLEFEKWSKAKVDGQLVTVPGLLKRRQAERQLFTSEPQTLA